MGLNINNIKNLLITQIKTEKFLDELISYNIESLKALEAVQNIDNNLPRDLLDELKKMPEEELNLPNKGIIHSEFNDNGKGE